MTIIKPHYINKDSFQIKRILTFEDMLNFVADVKHRIFSADGRYRPELVSTAVGSCVIKYYTTLKNDRANDYEFVYATFIKDVKDENGEDMNLLDYVLNRVHVGQYDHMVDAINEYIDVYKFCLMGKGEKEI